MAEVQSLRTDNAEASCCDSHAQSRRRVFVEAQPTCVPGLHGPQKKNTDECSEDEILFKGEI